MNCTNCGTLNEASFRFCMKCGTPLSRQPDVAQTTPEAQPATIQQEPPRAPPVAQAQSWAQPTFQPPSPPTFSRPAPLSQPNQQDYVYGGQGLSALNIWGPFAGFGTRRRHVGWLMDNRGDHTQKLVEKVDDHFRARQIPGAALSLETLAARGVAVENRPYFVLRRGLASLGLYIAQFGRDLFISLVSYLKPPISNFRVIVLGAMLLFWFYMTFLFPGQLERELDQALGNVSLFGGSSGDPGGLFGLLCLIGPVGVVNTFVLFLFLLYSTYKWLTEKDFWAGLRVAPNEFNEDDLMAMEKAVEQTVRIALDDIGLDPADLIPVEATGGRRLI